MKKGITWLFNKHVHRKIVSSVGSLLIPWTFCFDAARSPLLSNAHLVEHQASMSTAPSITSQPRKQTYWLFLSHSGDWVDDGGRNDNKDNRDCMVPCLQSFNPHRHLVRREKSSINGSSTLYLRGSLVGVNASSPSTFVCLPVQGLLRREQLHISQRVLSRKKVQSSRHT